jgi:hypothetical protein
MLLENALTFSDLLHCQGGTQEKRITQCMKHAEIKKSPWHEPNKTDYQLMLIPWGICTNHKTLSCLPLLLLT